MTEAIVNKATISAITAGQINPVDAMRALPGISDPSTQFAEGLAIVTAVTLLVIRATPVDPIAGPGVALTNLIAQSSAVMEKVSQDRPVTAADFLR